MAQQRLELTWVNKDKALIPTEHGRYGYTWVDPRDPRYCEIRPLVLDGQVHGDQSPKVPAGHYTDRADLEPQSDNLLIHGESGDVLEALTRVPELAEKYVGQVKCIYIDPPFNTSQTFPNYEDNLEHSVWLTMMRDRLLHLRVYDLKPKLPSRTTHAELADHAAVMNRLFGQLTVVQYLPKTLKVGNPRLLPAVFGTYPSVQTVPLNHTGAPDDWNEHRLWNSET